MVTTKTCDLCGKPAIAEITSKSTVTTEVRKDVCESHLVEYKKALRIFLGHEKQEDVTPKDD